MLCILIGILSFNYILFTNMISSKPYKIFFSCFKTNGKFWNVIANVIMLCYDENNHTVRQKELHSENQHLWHSSTSSFISSRLGKPNCWSSLSKTRNSDMYVFVNQFCNEDAGGRQGGFYYYYYFSLVNTHSGELPYQLFF